MTDILGDTSEDEYLRTVAAEALGWYFASTEKAQIVNKLEEIQKKGISSEKVNKEVTKTLKRLN